MPPTPEQTRLGYARLWNAARVRADKLEAAKQIAQRISANRARYVAVQDKTGVPWPMIGALHNRESGLSFNGVLHNGEKIIGTGRRTRLVPAGRGPFLSWEGAAVDALTMPGHRLNQIKTWSVERILYECERYNGWGYLGKTNSPYLWSWTDQYHGGKYVADHVWSASAWDAQAGCVAVFKALIESDPEALNIFFAAPREARPPDDVKKEASRQARRVRAGGGALAGGGAGVEGAKHVVTAQPDRPAAAFAHPVLLWSAIGIGVAMVIVAGVVIARKHRFVEQAWTGIEQKAPWIERAAAAAWGWLTKSNSRRAA